MSTVVIAVVLTALVFDFTNGFHDTANAMATSIASGALRPRVAVLLAGVLNLVGAFLSVQVALTISSGLVDEARITPEVIFGGLVGAILWNLVTWLLGMPSSSSHALFGGLIGATWVFAGTGAINFSTVAGKLLVPLALSPIVAGVVALAATWVVYRLAARGDRRTVTRGFRAAQVVSASMVALAHGTNDAQKTMGVITLTLITVGLLPDRRRTSAVGDRRRRAGDRRGHGHGRLADHPHDGPADQRRRDPAGLRGRDRQRGGDPERRAPGLRAVDHAGGRRCGRRLGRRSSRGRRPLAGGGPDGGRLAAHPAGRGRGGCAGRLGRRPRNDAAPCWSPPYWSPPPPASTHCPGASRSRRPTSTSCRRRAPVAVPARAAA